MSVQNGSCTSEVFQIKISDGLVHRLGSCPKTCIQQGCLQEHEFLGVCMRLQILMITPIRIHNRIFIGELFQIEVSDGPVHWCGS